MVIIKPGKNDHICWDASTTREVEDTVMNQPDVPIMDDEALITFGNIKMQFLTDIWNTRISNPGAILLLATADIKACYRYPRVSPDLTGAWFLAVGFLWYSVQLPLVQVGSLFNELSKFFPPCLQIDQI